MIKMLAFRNFSICAALLSMVAFTLTGCCSGNCGLLHGAGASAPVSHSGGCDTCGGGATYSAPAQSFATPTSSYSSPSYSTQGFSSGSVPTSAATLRSKI